MQLGIHLLQQEALPELTERHVVVPEPWIGVVELLRMIEGLEDEPPHKRPLGVVGLEALLIACRNEEKDVLRLIRRGIHGAKRYFDWREIPICFVLRGRLKAEAGQAIPDLSHAGHTWSLAPLVGHGLKPVDSELAGAWWWGPQLG